MGMDCIPRKKDVEPMHANWTGWRFIHMFLYLVDADLDRFSGSNDGVYVPARTAKKWGKLMLNLLDTKTIMLKEVSGFMGRREEIPWIVPEEDKQKDSVQLQVESVLEDSKILPIDDDTIKWLRGWAKFFIDSGGFSQW